MTEERLESLRKMWRDHYILGSVFSEMFSEIDRLRAEVERLRKDGERAWGVLAILALRQCGSDCEDRYMRTGEGRHPDNPRPDMRCGACLARAAMSAGKGSDATD